MLSTDRSEHRADHRRRPAARACDDVPWHDDAQPFDPDAPWNDEAAEALTRLLESEEGRLWRPATVDRAPPSHAPASDEEAEATEGIDRAWLEAHLSGLAERLQQALAEANPEATLTALASRLETMEQRFGATLGRVVQRSDLDGLRAIETRVLDLAAQLEQAHERLDRIGAVDEEVRALARKVEEAGAQRTTGLEKLLRDCITEWREGEQRTHSALQNIEEAIGKLGEAVEAMEASKPATDLTVPALTGTELGRLGGVEETAISSPPVLYPVLDAADYAPGERPGGAAPSLSAADAGASGGIDWSPGPREGSSAARLEAGALRITALRAKLRQSRAGSRSAAPSRVPPSAIGESRRGEIKRASLSFLLMAGAALVASSTYYLYRVYVVATGAGQ